jgi:excisionase family DNA binding protein
MSLAVPTSHSFLTTDGQNTALYPMPTELTVSEAAAVLDVPDGYVEELLNDDLIESRQEGSKRLIDYAGLLAYKREYERRHTALDEMFRIDREMGLYDE